MPVLYEMTPIIEKLNTIGAYTNANFGLTKIEQLRGKKVFIPSFDGVAWHTIVQTLIKEKLIPNCKIQHVADFFGDSCVRGIEGKNISTAIVEKLTRSCRNDGASGTDDVETEAIESIILDSTQVIFISLRKFRMYTGSFLLRLINFYICSLYNTFNIEVRISALLPNYRVHYEKITDWIEIPCQCI